MSTGIIYGLIFMSIIFQYSVASLRSSYGEACNKTQRCNTKGWLGCFEGVCTCMKQDSMEFDSNNLKCVSKLGEICKFSVGESENKNLFEIADCVENAECNSEGFCTCSSKYFESANGTYCVLSQSHGETCSETDKCSVQDHLKCVEGICRCDDDMAFSSDGCAGLSNKSCVKGKCVYGAKCSNEGKCDCLQDYFHNSPDQMCHKRKGISEACKEDFECSQKPGIMLICLNGTCSCEPNLVYDTVQKNEVYLGESQYVGLGMGGGLIRGVDLGGVLGGGQFVSRCVPLLGGSCPDGFCVSNTKCLIPSYRGSYTTPKENGTCVCLNNNFKADKKLKICAKPNGAQCQFTKECVDDLECINRICSCPMPGYQTFSSGENACITKVGGHCSSESTCVSNAVCTNDIGGMCECKEGFVANTLGHCEIAFGQNCSYLTICDSVASLVCVDNRCSCSDKMYRYSPEYRKCVGLVGTSCKVESVDQECTDDAYCSKVRPNLPGKCKCNPWSSQTADYMCQREQHRTLSLTE